MLIDLVCQEPVDITPFVDAKESDRRLGLRTSQADNRHSTSSSGAHLGCEKIRFLAPSIIGGYGPCSVVDELNWKSFPNLISLDEEILASAGQRFPNGVAQGGGQIILSVTYANRNLPRWLACRARPQVSSHRCHDAEKDLASRKQSKAALVSKSTRYLIELALARISHFVKRRDRRT
jgi:hypothetical protein